jgi:hypothetical protein
MKPKAKIKVAALPVLALCLLAIGIYIAAYFLLPGRYTLTGADGQQDVVIFPRRWQAMLFRPAAAIERFVTNRGTSAIWDDSPENQR